MHTEHLSGRSWKERMQELSAKYTHFQNRSYERHAVYSYVKEKEFLQFWEINEM